MKRSPLKKLSLREIPRLKRKLWKVFSLYIRKRDKFICFTCGREATGSAMHAGHLIPAGMSSAVRFDEKNVHAQCYHCNINLYGNGAIYSQRFILKYGQNEFDNLIKRSKKIKQWTTKELQSLEEEYKTKAQEQDFL